MKKRRFARASALLDYMEKRSLEPDQVRARTRPMACGTQAHRVAPQRNAKGVLGGETITIQNVRAAAAAAAAVSVTCRPVHELMDAPAAGAPELQLR